MDEHKNTITANVRNLEKEIERRKKIMREKRNEMREFAHKMDKNKKRIEILKVFQSVFNRLHFSFPLGYDSKSRHEPREKTGESKNKR